MPVKIDEWEVGVSHGSIYATRNRRRWYKLEVTPVQDVGEPQVVLYRYGLFTWVTGQVVAKPLWFRYEADRSLTRDFQDNPGFYLTLEVL